MFLSFELIASPRLYVVSFRVSARTPVRRKSYLPRNLLLVVQGRGIRVDLASLGNPVRRRGAWRGQSSAAGQP